MDYIWFINMVYIWFINLYDLCNYDLMEINTLYKYKAILNYLTSYKRSFISLLLFFDIFLSASAKN